MKTNTKIPSSYKYSKHLSLLTRLSRSTLRGSLFAMAIAVVATWSVILTHASPQPSVRTVYFCPKDACKNINEANEKFFLNRYMTQVQSWYKSQLGHTFNYVGATVIYGQHNSFYYKETETDDDTLTLLEKEPGISQANMKTIVMGPNQWLSSSHCGIAGVNGPVGIVETASSTKCAGDYQYLTMAHELGHTFGLYPYSKDNHTHDGTLMDPAGCGNNNTLATCKLDEPEKSYLLRNRLVWFPVGSNPSYNPPPKPGTSPGSITLATITACKSQTFSKGSSGTCVSYLQTLLNGSGASIKTDGSFGDLTRTAVIKFQTSKGLCADGIVGPNTWKALTGDNSYPKGCSSSSPPSSKPTQAPDKNMPIGHVDGAGCNVDGWTFDWDNAYVSIGVHIYVDGPTGKSPYPAFTTTANVYRSDVDATFPIKDGSTTKPLPGNHGFKTSIPGQYRGKTHTYYVYGIGINTANVTSGGNAYLGSASGYCATTTSGPHPS